MSGRNDLRRMVASLLELPGDVMLDVARVSLVGRVELLVENHRGIAAYKPDRVVLAVPEGYLAVSGRNLLIGSISPDQVIVRGEIDELAYRLEG